MMDHKETPRCRCGNRIAPVLAKKGRQTCARCTPPGKPQIRQDDTCDRCGVRTTIVWMPSGERLCRQDLTDPAAQILWDSYYADLQAYHAEEDRKQEEAEHEWR